MAKKGGKRGDELRKLADHIDHWRDEAQKWKDHENEALQDAEEKLHLHKGAFKSALKLRRLDLVERAAWLRAFDEYRDLLGLDDQLDMFEERRNGRAEPESVGDAAARVIAGVS